jgi:DNA-binding NarL/FixJ family response regulator
MPVEGASNPPPDPGEIATRAGRIDLIGRRLELDAIRREIDTARAEGPRVLLLAGEAGIGKSRLLDETRRMMAETGGIVAIGRCVDERGMPPYLPWILALSELGEHLEGEAANLRDLLLSPRDVVEAVSLGPDQLRLRLFDTVAQAVRGIAMRVPLMLAFDDLQWSDEASNALLRYVAVQVTNAPLLIAGAYRREELTTNVELARTLEELDRRRLLRTIRVGPLSAGETELLLDDLVGGIEPSLATSIHKHSEGNPFFIEEVARSLAEEGVLADGVGMASALPLPSGVAAVIQRRLDRLDRDCRNVLDYAALAGREIAVDLVAVSSRNETDEVAALLDGATRAGLVRPANQADASFGEATRPIDFVFTHDRIRETIDAAINPVRRRTIHANLAAALEADGEAQLDLARLAALTHHYRNARMPDQARRYAILLGDASIRSRAYGEAERAYNVAIDLLPGRDNSGELWLKFGEAALAGGSPEAVTAFASAKQAFDSDGDLPGGARSLFRLGVAHARREELDLAVSCFEAAATAIDHLDANLADSEIGAEHARVLIELGNILGTSLADYETAIEAGQRALDLAQQISDSPSLEAEARLALAKTLMRCCRLEEGHELLAPALSLAHGAGNFDLASEVAGVLANHAYWIGDVNGSERFGLRRRDLAAQAGDPFARRHSRPWLANVALAQGKWDATERLITEAEPDVALVDSPEPRAFLQCLTGLLNFQRGEIGQAVNSFEEAMVGFRQSGPATLAWYHGLLAHAYHVAGDLAAAERAAAETAEIVMSLPELAMPRAPSLAQLGLVAVRASDLPSVRRWYAELRPYSGQHHWVLMDRPLGMLAAALGDLTSANRYLSAALETAIRGGIGPERALTLFELGKLGARANRSDAPVLLTEAIELLGKFDMRAALNEAEGALATLNGDKPAVYPHGLTEREVAVLALVAQGLTNREIGDHLGISDKTVTNHLTHIFTKANLDNRSSAVAFAFRHGLA